MTQRVLDIQAPASSNPPLAEPLRACANGEANKLRSEDRPVHDWYRFVLSYPPHFVREYLQRFDLDGSQPLERALLDSLLGILWQTRQNNQLYQTYQLKIPLKV